MAGLIMLGLIALMILTLIVMLFMRKEWKRILITFVGFLVVIGIFNFYVVKTCGPNDKDVEIMKPQAEVISDYIIKNGIPKSLAGIPNLPYKLENCKWTEKNVEWCYFNVDGDKHSIRFYFIDYRDGIDIDVRIHNEKSETGIYSEIEKKSNSAFKIAEHIKAYSTKNDGVCNPLRM